MERFVLFVCYPGSDSQDVGASDPLKVEVAILDSIDQVNDLVRMAEESGGVVRVLSVRTPVTDLTEQFV